jgi:hypothetical protein
LISGNIEKLFPEIDFDYLILETDKFSLEIISNIDTKRSSFEIALVRENYPPIKENIFFLLE